MSLSFSSEPENYRERSGFATVAIELLNPYQVHLGRLVLQNIGQADVFYTAAKQGNAGNPITPEIVDNPYFPLSVDGVPLAENQGIKLSPGEQITFVAKEGKLKLKSGTLVIADLPDGYPSVSPERITFDENAGALAYRPFG